MQLPFTRSQSRWLIFVPRYLSLTMMLSLLIGLIMALMTSVLYFQLQPVVPLFYSLPRESQHLVAKEWLFMFPTVSMIITILHGSILTSSRHSETLLLKLFAWTTVSVQTILFLALLRIVFIIT